MKHVRLISKPVHKAYGIGIGQYLLLAGQVLGILALLFVEKPEPDTETEKTGTLPYFQI